MQRVWLRVTLAASAGLVSLAVCSGAFVAILLLCFAMGDFFFGWLGSSLDPTLFLFGVGTAVLLAAASLSLPALALGARGGHLTKTALLSAFGFCAFVLFLIVSSGKAALVLFALVALVATPVVGSLVAVQVEGPRSVFLGRATLIAAVAIYCASSLVYWATYGEEGIPYSLAPLIVASSSWLVVPAIVALLRSD